MKRILVIPAAGTGSRLGSALPKVLVPVLGRPMIDHLLALYAGWVEGCVLVLNPTFAAEVEAHCRRPSTPLPIDIALQPEPTGMLDAILCARQAVQQARPEEVWITWCDQIAIRPITVQRLAAHDDDAALVFPTMIKKEPYIHFVRAEGDVILDVLHRREGDAMPAEGENDMGLFALDANTYLHQLPRFARQVRPGTATGERSFLPFIPWLHQRAAVFTFPGHQEMESVGINTPQDLAQVEAFLRHG